MNGFDVLFSLLSLLLGLAMAEILGDFGRVIERRRIIKIGWLTPLLALLVMLDLGSFWSSAYGYRNVLVANDLSILAVLAFASVYYLIATLVVPEDLEGVKDLDQHYWRNRRIVIGGIILLNLPNIPLTIAVGAGPVTWSIVVAFYSILVALFVAKGARANVILLLLVISIYWMVPVYSELIARFHG